MGNTVFLIIVICNRRYHNCEQEHFQLWMRNLLSIPTARKANYWNNPKYNPVARETPLIMHAIRVMHDFSVPLSKGIHNMTIIFYKYFRKSYSFFFFFKHIMVECRAKCRIVI